MRSKFICLTIVCAVLPLAACDETYDAVSGTNQVLVRDDTNKIDRENIDKACAAKGQKTSTIAWVGNGKTAALVDCVAR